MTPHDLFLEASRLGLRLESAGAMLAVLPKGKCTPEFADILRQHKMELLNWLSHPPCPGWQAVPPDSLPLVAIPPAPNPENRERVISYLWRQTGDRHSPLMAWLIHREITYYNGPGQKWDCGLLCYAAARDAGCWQLNRAEGELWSALAGFDECHEQVKKEQKSE